MPETLSAAEFEQRLQEVSERLEALRGTPRATGGLNPSLPYAGLDLEPELPALASVLASLLHQDPDEPLTRNPRTEVAARRLGLAALQAILAGGEGLADFPARYQQVMGTEPEYALFEGFLPAAMREAGILPAGKADARRLLEALLAAAGLPASLVVATTEYFILYWRWFHPLNDVLAPLHWAEAGRELPGLTAEQRERLSALAKRLLPNAAVLCPVVEGLSLVMIYLRSQPKWRVGDLFTQSETIREACGIDPQALLLGNEEAFGLLAGALGHAWHPEQFRHVLTSLPRDGEVRMPNGSLTMAQRAVAIPYWGLYRVEHKTYMVLPDEGLTLDEIKAMPAGVRLVGHRVLWKGDADAAVTADGWPQITGPRHLFEDRASQGWFYYNVPPAARTLKIGEATLAPYPSVYWRTSLHATCDSEGKPRLNVRVAGLRLCLPELAGSTLQLEVPQAETAGRLTFELDERGVGGLPELLLPITAPAAGVVEIFLQDHTTGTVVERDGKPLSYKLSLPEVLLASDATGLPIAPSERFYPFGTLTYLAFAARPLNTGALQMQDIGVTTLGKVGEYEVYRFSWDDPGEPLQLNLGAGFSWIFESAVEDAWAAGDLPAAKSPLQYAPVTPTGYTVATVDDLYVDDVSLIPEPLVVVTRDDEILAAHTWDELNWMMSFPEDNRRFSGMMFRRALHVTPEFDLAGRYTLMLRAGGQVLGERQVLVLPELKLDVAPSGPQLEDVTYQLVASCGLPCFEGGEKQIKLPIGQAVVDRDVMENTPFQPKPLEATLRLAVPLFDLSVGIQPDVIGFRLLDENEGTWVRKTMLGYDELGHITLVIFGTHGKQARLEIEGAEPAEEEFYEGFATFSLASVKARLSQHETEIRVRVDGREVGTLTTVWHPTIAKLEASNEYLLENVARLELEAEGPAGIPVVLKAFSPEGRELGKMDVEIASGQVQEVAFDLPASRDYPVVTIKAYVPTEQTGVASASVEVRNASFDPEIEALNKRIAAEPQNPDLRYERAQLLLARGLRKAAARDFQGAVDLGMTELLESSQYQQFMSQRQAESFHEDIKALASFFVPFARKELSIG